MKNKQNQCVAGLFLLALLLVSCSNNNSNKITEYYDAEKTKIKSVVEVIDSITQKGDTIKLLNGNAIYYYENGNIRIKCGFYKSFGIEKNQNSGVPSNGRDGEFLSYYENGNRKIEINYNKGRAIKLVGYYENGNLKSKEKFYDNSKIKSHINYSENGVIEDDKEFTKEGKVIILKEYSEAGNLVSETFMGDKNYRDVYEKKILIKREYLHLANKYYLDSVIHFNESSIITKRELYEKGFEDETTLKYILNYYPNGKIKQKEQYESYGEFSEQKLISMEKFDEE